MFPIFSLHRVSFSFSFELWKSAPTIKKEFGDVFSSRLFVVQITVKWTVSNDFLDLKSICYGNFGPLKYHPDKSFHFQYQFRLCNAHEKNKNKNKIDTIMFAVLQLFRNHFLTEWWFHWMEIDSLKKKAQEQHNVFVS